MGLEDNITSSKYVENTVSKWMKHFVIVTENSTKDAEMGAKETYDGMGAMQYIVAVVLIYSTAVIGVFVLGFVSRRHKQNVQIDKQANFFLKDINQTRIVIERQERKKSIASYLRSSSVDSSSSASNETVRNSLLTAVAIPMTSLSMTSNYHKAGYRRSISAPLFRIPESHSENCSGNEIENDKIENFQSYDELDSTKVTAQAENCSLLVNPRDDLKETCFIEESLGNFGLHGMLDTSEHPERQTLLKECNGDRTIPFSDYTCGV